MSEQQSEQAEQVFPHVAAVPFDPNISLYDCAAWHLHDAQPLEYSGWRDEILSWKTGVGIGAVLNPTPVVYYRGPDAKRFMSDISVNNFEKFKVGAAKHAIMCNDKGLVMAHGLALCTGEDEVCTILLSPWPEFMISRAPGKYDVEVDDRTGERFMFQVAGPRSLETLEAATGENLHDIRFMRHRTSTIDGRDVRILRIGMAGVLAYEVHGNADDASHIYNCIREAGKQFGIRRMGVKAYMLNHTEAGFPQLGFHFPAPWAEEEGLGEYLATFGAEVIAEPVAPRGSLGSDPGKLYRNPIELGWGHMVKFDHDFVGREALERYGESPPQKMVTLEWNKEDILDVFRSEWEPGEPYLSMHEPNHFAFCPTPGKEVEGEDQAPGQWADEVRDASGKLVGISTGRTYSALFHETLSLGLIDVELAEEGNELTLIWGEPGTRQKEIRVKVARFPYLNENRNEKVDVSTIPAIGSPAAV